MRRLAGSLAAPIAALMLAPWATAAAQPAITVTPAPPVAKPVEGLPEAAALNRRILEENKALQARNDAAQARFEAQQTQFRAAQAAYEAEVRAQAAAFEAAQRKHAEDLKAWEAKVTACRSGDYAACRS